MQLHSWLRQKVQDISNLVTMQAFGHPEMGGPQFCEGKEIRRRFTYRIRVAANVPCVRAYPFIPSSPFSSNVSTASDSRPSVALTTLMVSPQALHAASCTVRRSQIRGHITELMNPNSLSRANFAANMWYTGHNSRVLTHTGVGWTRPLSHTSGVI